MSKRDVSNLFRFKLRILKRTVLLLYTILILGVGIYYGTSDAKKFAFRDETSLRLLMNEYKVTRSGVRCLPRHYAKYITLPEKLVIKDSNLLQTIQKEAPSIDVFPLDIIIDINQLDYNYAFNQGAFEVSSIPDVYQSSVDMSLEESAFRNSKITFYHLIKMSRRYDLSYDAFLPFHKFYLSALNATQEQVDECLASFTNMSPKEKALALSAVYIFEQRARKPSRKCKRRYDDIQLKYNAYKTRSSFNDEKWQSFESLLNDNSSNEEVAFDAIPNEGLIKQWETSLRRNALLYQYNLSYYNPFLFVIHDWAPLCRKAPLSFVYALLWSETEMDFLNSDKEFPRMRPFGLPIDFELSAIERYDNGAGIKDQRIDIPYLTEEEKARISIVYDLKGRANYYVGPNDYVITMREYLKTQESARRSFYPGFDGSIFTFKNDVKVPVNLISQRDVPSFNANTSYEAKTLGFIASTLLHARGLFDESE